MSDVKIWYEPREAVKYESLPRSPKDKSCPRCRSTMGVVVDEFREYVKPGEHVAIFRQDVVKCENCEQLYVRTFDIDVE